MNGFPIAGLLLITAGCAGGYDPSATPPGIRNLQNQRHAALERLRDTALQPLRLWQEEHPPSCGSPNLRKARANVLTAASMLSPSRSGIDAAVESGSWILEVADVAREQDCKSTARSLYDAVIATYTEDAAATARRDRHR